MKVKNGLQFVGLLRFGFIWLALVAAQTCAAAARSPEKVRIAVSSKSLGFLDTWAGLERGFYRLDEAVAIESHELYSRLIVDDARPIPTAVKTVLAQEGKTQLALDRVVDATIVEEVSRDRR